MCLLPSQTVMYAFLLQNERLKAKMNTLGVIYVSGENGEKNDLVSKFN